MVTYFSNFEKLFLLGSTAPEKEYNVRGIPLVTWLAGTAAVADRHVCQKDYPPEGLVGR